MKTKTRTFDFFISGVKYHDFQIDKTLKAGSSLDLIGEPNNKYDPFAIRIVHNKFKLGYVPKQFCQEFWNLKRLGSKFKATLAYKAEEVLRVSLTITIPYNERTSNKLT